MTKSNLIHNRRNHIKALVNTHVPEDADFDHIVISNLLCNILVTKSVGETEALDKLSKITDLCENVVHGFYGSVGNDQ